MAQFCGITASDPAIAEQYLLVSDNNLEQAVTLFLESGGAPIQDVSERPQSNTANAQPQSPEPIRAPIESVTERLVDPMQDMFDEARARTGSFMSSRMGMGLNSRRNMPTGIFNQALPGLGGIGRTSGMRTGLDDEFMRHDNEDYEDDEDQLELGSDEFMQRTVGTSRLTSTQSRLANLFRPPFDLISNITFDQAKAEAISERRWLLVNIQDNSEFECQMLNRDLWADPTVKGSVSANFIFLQWSSDSEQGNEYCQFYPFSKYPHISIIDPRTGEQLKVWSTVPSTEQFLEDIHDFLSAFSLEPGHRNPVVPARQKPIDHMTEEEQINFAMQESLGRSQGSGHNDNAERRPMNSGTSADNAIEIDDSDNDDDEEFHETMSSTGFEEGSFSSKQQEQVHRQMEGEDHHNESKLTDDDILATILPSDCPEEPGPGPDTTRIQIRTSDGKRIVRRFAKSDTVAGLFAFVKKDIEQVRGHYFGLTSERRKLLDMRNQTLADAKLLNASVMVEILD